MARAVALTDYGLEEWTGSKRWVMFFSFGRKRGKLDRS